MPALGQPYSLTEDGRVFRHVKCEECHTDFVCLTKVLNPKLDLRPLTVDNRGKNRRIFERARQELYRTLDKSVRAAPCPYCGCYQHYMRSITHGRYHKRLFWGGLLMFLLAYLSGAYAWVKIAPPREYRENEIVLLVYFLTTFNAPTSTNRPNDPPTGIAIALGVTSALAAATGVGLIVLRKWLATRFHPNTDTSFAIRQQDGEQAFLKSEFEKTMQPIRPRDDVPRADEGARTQPHLVTVFTPTYNRAATLPRVYLSLRQQTCRNFEWLVIDDGSTDGTRKLVEDWQKGSDFPIRYVYQENRGKHAAFNRAVELALGELFINLDSDDECLPEAIDIFCREWEEIHPDERGGYSAVTCLCQDQHGRVVGSQFPFDEMDGDYLSLRYVFWVRGEKWSCHRTAVLREFPFPTEKAYYVPEGIIWSQVARKYRERCINEPLRIYHVAGPSLVHGQTPGRAAQGGRMQHLHTLNEELDYFRHAPLDFARSAVHYARFSWHLGIGVRQQYRDLHGLWARLLWAAALPAARLVYWRDRWRN